MSNAQFVIGIDLGTTHCALAFSRLDEPHVRLLKIAQLVGPGEVSESSLLPSFIYLPVNGELTDSERRLPWGQQAYIVGSLARKRGAKAPGRLISSAKSWICHGGVNRRAAILPWGAPDSEDHLSPYAAQVIYLTHLASVWKRHCPDPPLSEQEVIVAVPASFDEGARQLTSEAAEEAGWGQVRLVEEPQAAFYDYLASVGTKKSEPGFSSPLEDARLILVVDVGGGTTDLTLLRVKKGDDSGGSPPFVERIAVGGHLMLGGDNMDAALAMHALTQSGISRPDDATIWSGLVQSARAAKEILLGDSAPNQAVISYQGRGSKLIGKTKSLVIEREDAQKFLLDGFFPLTSADDAAKRNARAGLTTLGLPFATDTAIPRQICAFLRRHLDAASEAGASIESGLPRPDLVLLNGGVFKAPAAVKRLMDVFTGWFEEGPPLLLDHTSLDTSVAQGAVHSGLGRHGLGVTIGGGTAKAYYIGIEGEGRRVALCVAPKHIDEGVRLVVPGRTFSLLLNEPVQFALYSYSGDRIDAPGTVLSTEVQIDELEALPPIETLLRDKNPTPGRRGECAVTLESFLDEKGGLQLYLVSTELPPKRWKLQFVLRQVHAKAEKSSDAAASETLSAREKLGPHKEEAADPKTHAAGGLISRALSDPDEDGVKSLRRQLEEQLGPRGHWSAATCRELFDSLLPQAPHRQVSGVHELNWLRLTSWTMRPGFGACGDEDRMDALWALRAELPMVFNKSNWAEWWILWRRAAGGLDGSRQRSLFEDVSPYFWSQGKPSPGQKLHASIEAMRMLASLEHLPVEYKVRAGELFLQRAKKIGSYWPLGRVGARSLFLGQPASVVSPDVGAAWLNKLLALDWEKAEGAAFAAASIARFTGDARRDIEKGLRQQVVNRLTEADANAGWIDMVLRNTELARGDMVNVLGDSLPAGLRLV